MRKKHFMSRKTEKEEGHLELKKLAEPIVQTYHNELCRLIITFIML